MKKLHRAMLVNTKSKLLNLVAPLYTLRRLGLSILRDVIFGSGFKRLCWINFINYQKYRHRKFTCNVCGKKGTPFYDFPNVRLREMHKVGLLRETLACKFCGATVRTRTLAFELLKEANNRFGTEFRDIDELSTHGLRGLRVLDTDAFSPISARLSGVDGYVKSSYFPDRAFGAEISPSYFNINLEDISFEDKSFDIVLSSDVMEHVRFCDKAHSEIHRILKLNGAYVFTVPNDMSMSKNWILIDQNDSDKALVYPQHYHGDPLSGGILSYRVLGQELLLSLKEIGFAAEYCLVQEPATLILDGDIFYAKKLFNE